MVKKNFEKICMIGMPGSGKSTIGRALSDYLKFDFYDTDAVSYTHLTLPTILLV